MYRHAGKVVGFYARHKFYAERHLLFDLHIGDLHDLLQVK